VKYLPRVLPYLWPYKRFAAGTVALTILSGLIGLLEPWSLQILIDNVLGGAPLPPWLAAVLGPLAKDRVLLLVITVTVGVAVVLLGNVITVLTEYMSTTLDQRMVLDFRGDMFQHAQRLSQAYHDQRRTGGFIAKINMQSAAVGALPMMAPPLAQSAITLVGMVWIVFTIDQLLALLSMVVVPFIYYSIGYYTNRIQPRLLQVREMEGQSISIVHEAMSMLRVVVAFGREPYEYRRFRTQGDEAVGARVHLTIRQTLFSLAINLITAIGTALVLGYGAYRVLQGELSVGQLLVVMAYIAAVYAPLQQMSSAVTPLQEHLISLQGAFELMEAEPEVRDAPDAVEIEQAKGHIVFDDVGFSYQRRIDTLKHVSFEVQPGQVVAIVGPTGAGKSTMASLIPRFYDPQKGRILLDGMDIRQISARSLRAQISIVLQEPLLFSGTIADNIRYGRLEASMEEIVAAAEAANAHDFILGLPKQYDTEIGERGAQLSGGERQRIAVARAFLKDAPILILDEPTSSIDSRTEAVILDALDRLMVGRTTFMIAHRLSTIRHADVILVVHRGELVEQGTHEELLARDGLYRQLHEVQNRQARRRAEPALAYHTADRESGESVN
jgi:ATP-binding cassette, subfamily B, bacterial